MDGDTQNASMRVVSCNLIAGQICCPQLKLLLVQQSILCALAHDNMHNADYSGCTSDAVLAAICWSVVAAVAGLGAMLGG